MFKSSLLIGILSFSSISYANNSTNCTDENPLTIQNSDINPWVIYSVGIVASVLSLASTPPQIYKIFKTKMANDISGPSLIIRTLGSAAWLAYSSLTKDYVLIATSVTNIVFSGLMILGKCLYGMEPVDAD